MPTKSKAAPTPGVHPVATALNTILDEVAAIYLERRGAIEAVLLAVLSKQHVFLLGKSGTGKSEMIREIISRWLGASYYENLLSKTRPDAAILGPYNLPLLRDKGDFHRKTAGFLPTANFAFLDEIGKMSPTLGHDLLSILNERLYHEVNGGRSAKDVPLYTAFTASNELIVEESDDAAALWDRLLVRIQVDYLQESSNFAALMQSAHFDPLTQTATRTELDFEELADVIDNVVPSVDVPLNAIEAMLRLRDAMRSAGLIVSDRRWKQSIRLMQASAFLAGRTEVTEDDVHVLRYVLWDNPTQISNVERLCLSVSNPIAEKCLVIMDDLDKLSAGIRDHKGIALNQRGDFATECNGKLSTMSRELFELRTECEQQARSTTKIDETVDRLLAIKRAIYTDLLEMDPSLLAKP